MLEVMNNRLKILAQKFLPNIRVELTTPQEYFDWLTKYVYERRDFFEDLTPDEFLKILFYIYSLKTTGTFDLAEQIFERLQFIGLLYTEGDPSMFSCPECDGGGRIECYECSGGKLDCSECDGEGKVQCSECEGDGKVEDDEGEMVPCDLCTGEGEIECDECAGEGRVECDECGGMGDRYCDECSGDGEIESDTEVNVNYYLICSWSNDINSKCEVEVQTTSPITDNEKLLFQNDQVIKMNLQELNFEPKEFFGENEYYCCWIDDSPKLVFDYKKRIEARVKVFLDFYSASFYAR